jgi:hypothetical protein
LERDTHAGDRSRRHLAAVPQRTSKRAEGVLIAKARRIPTRIREKSSIEHKCIFFDVFVS